MTMRVNNKEIEFFNFSGGECHVSVRGIRISDVTQVVAYLHNSDAIMSLLMVVDAIRQEKPDTEIHLTIPYFPYARQDRVCNTGEAFSAKVMAGLINGLQCHLVTVFDPHSEVVTQHLHNCHVIEQVSLIKGDLVRFITDNRLILISPDKGAQSKAEAVAEFHGFDVINCSKVRDTQNGHITKSEVHGDVRGKDLIILDDICDGGRTFIELAKVLKSQGAGKLYLYVTHGIFSKGLEVLKEHFEHVFCYHSFLCEDDLDTEFLTVMEGEGK